MTFKATVHKGAITLPADANIQDGTAVEVTVRARASTLGDLLQHTGRWHGDDAEEVIELIYRSRSSRHPVEQR